MITQRIAPDSRSWPAGGRPARFGAVFVVVLAFSLIFGIPRTVQADPLRDALDGLVMVIADVPNDARTSDTLGSKRRGAGVAIDDDGLVVTIGYVILEADQVRIMDRTGKVTPAEIVSYDHETGFGLVRALAPIEATAVKLGHLADHEIGAVLYAAAPGEIAAVELMEKRPFAGGWEYLLEEAAFTSPPIRNFGGAALLDESGLLVGIGSLIVPDAGHRPGNMFVPIELLPPILGDMLAFGRSTAAAPPWLGLYPDESRRGLVISRVARGGPADSVGISPGDRILAVGDDPVTDLENLWRRVRAYGPVGSNVPLRVFSRGAEREVMLTSRDRRGWLKLERSY